MQKIVSFLNSCKLGDILYSVAGMNAYCKRHNAKARLYLRPNVTNPSQDGNGEIMLTNESYDALRPLLMQQDFIEDVREYTGEPIDVNLDAIRQAKIGMPFGHIGKWYEYVFPEMHADLHEVWLQFNNITSIAEMVKGSIIISLSNNYRNQWIRYEFLNIFHTELPIFFIGWENEAQDFINKVPRAKWLKCDDFNEIAVALSSCKVFLGNQNAVFAVAEGLKIPRILEVFPFVPNVIPQGKDGFDFHTQNSFEFYLKECLK
jgi:hypothetical protein